VLVSRHGTNGSIQSIWFGMRCEFTRQAISGAGDPPGTVEPVAIVLPRAPKPRGAGWPEPPFDRWLRERGIAIIEVGRLAGRDLAVVRDAIEGHGLTLGVGACFPFRIPASLRSALPCGVLNIHPSLLPMLRGPEPVFHAYRLGLAETGVTVHLMDDGWDSGPVVAQERVPIPETGSAAGFEAKLARRGGQMLAAVAPRWRLGDLAPVPQDESEATWAPVPDEGDRTVPADLTAFRASRFVQACAPLLATDADTGEIVPVEDVVAPNRSDCATLRSDRRVVRMRCRDGELWLLRQG
jgi:methionyl-tRNA formyltransferase